ncbi:MAG: glycosyl hydrolase [Chitinophagaceae bacterium]
MHKQRIKAIITGLLSTMLCFHLNAQGAFVERKEQQFMLNGKPYYYIGTNYWYGSVLGLEKDKSRGIERLRKELDFLRGQEVTNLRVLVGAEGTGFVNGVERVGPPLQPEKGKFDEKILQSLDLLLFEMSKRNMKAVLYLSNNWEWSGGFLQYLRWNNAIPEEVFRRKLNWDELRDYVSKFYTCDGCKQDYLLQVKKILAHTNKYSGKKYTQEPAIMAWELANEPRPMRPAAIDAYKQWISDVAATIRAADKNHLITTGAEGYMGTENLEVFEAIHADRNIDYCTIHIWPKNWGWFQGKELAGGFDNVLSKTKDYLQQHLAIAQKIKKPLVVEEFGLPRDGHSFDINATTSLRNSYYGLILRQWQHSKTFNDALAGCNFWAFNGTARPVPGQEFWKKGDDYMGDPPMEEQGLNGVFDSDTATWKLISGFSKGVDMPADPLATKETVNLYHNLKKLLNKGIMFGHQDDLAYGVDWKYVPGKSDVKELVNDYPAVYGWELGNIEHDLPYNIDSVPFDKMRGYIQQAYQKGSVITISWHADNPLNGASAWDTTHGSVAAILPGGAKHEIYTAWLDKVAAFLLTLRGAKGEYIPVLFRPFHELTGNWFWWCRNACTPGEFKSLWRFTINYLRQKNVHHLLYVYNTADFSSKEAFIERYPGDDVADLVSFDSYQYNDPAKDNSFLKNVDKQLTILEEFAAEKGKIPALGETGYEAIPYATWWTNTLWAAIGHHRISYVLLWRNAGRMKNGKWHYYVPKKEDVSTEDFKAFYRLDRTLFEKDVSREKLYQ